MRSLAVRTLRLHDRGRQHRRIVHCPTVPHRGNWVGRLSFRSRSLGPASATGTPATTASSGSPLARGLGRPSSTAPTAWSPTRRAQLLWRGAARRPRPQPRNWMVLGVPANTAHYDDRAILSGHGPSLRWALVPLPRGDEHRRVETHSDPRVHHPHRHGARLGRPAGGRSTCQRVRRPSRAARADRRRPCRPPARHPRP